MRATAAPPASTSITALLPQPLPFLGGGCCATGRLVPGFTLRRATALGGQGAGGGAGAGAMSGQAERRRQAVRLASLNAES